MRRFAGAMLAAGFAAATLVPLTLTEAASGASAGQSAPATPSPTASSSQKPSRPGKTPSTPTPAPTPTQRVVPAGPPAPVGGMPKPSANCVSQRGRPHLTSEPWAQRALDFSSVWDLTKGQHVTVAVVDSGIDYTPQLAGRVTRTDLTGGNGEDCVPHGTIVASIIAASDARAKGVPFYGVAPAAHILAIRVQQQEDTGSLSVAARRRTLLNIANGLRYAVAEHAKVINVSIQVSASYPALRAAVAFALNHNVVVVAAAGNDSPGGGQGPFYPASYPGVLSVNAVGQNGQLGDFDVSGTPVSVTAPGVDVASDYPGGFDPANNGTSFATAFVSGEAALVRAAYPRLSAAQVVHRIIATADGGAGAHTGAGMINPVQAVTEVLPRQSAGAGAAAAGPASRVPVPRPSGVSSATRTVAFSVTGGAIGVAALVAIGAVVVPQGRRRHWRAGRFGSAPIPITSSDTAPGPARPKRAAQPEQAAGAKRQADPGRPAETGTGRPAETRRARRARRPARPKPAARPERTAEADRAAQLPRPSGPSQLPGPGQLPGTGWLPGPSQLPPSQPPASIEPTARQRPAPGQVPGTGGPPVPGYRTPPPAQPPAPRQQPPYRQTPDTGQPPAPRYAPPSPAQPATPVQQDPYRQTPDTGEPPAPRYEPPQATQRPTPGQQDPYGHIPGIGQPSAARHGPTATGAQPPPPGQQLTSGYVPAADQPAPADRPGTGRQPEVGEPPSEPPPPAPRRSRGARHRRR
jgi:membrane-anchored mycosin MYCP